MTTTAQILVTGGYGCIGAPTVKWLLANTSAHVVAASRDTNAERTRRLFPEQDQQRLTCVPLDIRVQSQLEELLTRHEITHVIHLAALQTPDCNAHRDLGLQINLAGTQHLIEAIKTCRPALERFVFASSISVYGPRASYPAGKVPMLAEPAPTTAYGIWKLAGEHLSRMFHEETGIPTISLRPGVLFGPGRDAGMTAVTTTAMKRIALGVPYEIPFRSRQDFLYAPDVGAAFAKAAVDPFRGYGVFTLPSHTVDTAGMIETMRRAAVELGLSKTFAITAGTLEVPFICDLDFEPFMKAFPDTPHTPLAEAVQASLKEFQRQVTLGWLKD